MNGSIRNGLIMSDTKITTKEDIINLVLSCNPTPEIKDMVIGYIDLAYKLGFDNGMITTNQMHIQIQDMVLGVFK